MAAARRAMSLFASPAVLSDSCETTGSPSLPAATATGSETYPPAQNTPSACASRRARFACRTAAAKRKGRFTFFSSAPRTSLGQAIV